MAHQIRERGPALTRGQIRSAKQKNTLDAVVGSRLRMRREMLNMSQTDVACQIGVSFQQLQKYEKGHNRIGAGRLMEIASILRVTPAWFFERDSTAAAVPDAALAAIYEFMLSTDGRHLSRAFMRLPAPMRRAVVALVEQVADDCNGKAR